MTRKTFDDWKNLVEKKITSGLSVPQFCHRHNLNPKYCYSRKLKVVNASEHTGFIQVQVITEQTTLLAVLLSRFPNKKNWLNNVVEALAN